MPALATLVSLAACGDTVDDRPATREYIVAAILAPSCGNGGCHSSATAAEGYAFDTLDAANEALDELVSPGNLNSRLLTVLRATGESRMPLDGPLPDDDIALIEKWIQGGAQ